jgi:uncharacterized hydrophobic protein (TIGR00271 family)
VGLTGNDGRVLHLRLRVPEDLVDDVAGLLEGEGETAVNVAVLPGAYRRPDGDLVMLDLPREGAQRLLGQLHEIGLVERGSITIVDDEVVLSAAASEAERSTPGAPEDGVVWDVVEDHAREDMRLSFSYVVFLVLATLIAGVGRLQDQPVLIVGAMVVGPEFAPMAAICLAVARPRLGLLPGAALTLVGGYVIAVVVGTVIWWVVYLLGGFDPAQLHHGPQTDFIIQPSVWSLVIAVLAGTAGVLSLTTDKSSTLVGVFISVTTVPAVAVLSLALATGDGGDAVHALEQLGINVFGILVAGTLTLLLQRVIWSHTAVPTPRRRSPKSGWFAAPRP